MKKILMLPVLALLCIGSIAQIPIKTVKTVTAADTIQFPAVKSAVVSMQATYVESSGTSAGKIYFEGTTDGSWVTFDSLAISDVTTRQTKFIGVTSTSYLGYRIRFTNTSSATGTLSFCLLRRPDDDRDD